ncbi:MAG: damage-inducible protein DinB [Methyloglobulus sp.]|nr:damage-inducible protein DinB [Methyloglobulus sp.]
MIDQNQFELLADYNRWMNEKIYSTCSHLSDSELMADRGAFFKSIYHTLNHIMYGDLAFMSRFTGVPEIVPDLGVELFDTFSQLKTARFKLDTRIANWVKTLEEKWLLEVLTYTSKVDGKSRSVPRWVLVIHMFNHQTHHRGQITTLLSQLGLDIGSTDIPFMARFQAF